MLFLFGVVWHPEINSASSDKSEASRPLEMKNNSFKKIDQKKNKPFSRKCKTKIISMRWILKDEKEVRKRRGSKISGSRTAHIKARLVTEHWRRQWHPTPVLLPGKSQGRRSLVGCSPWDRKESDTTEWLHFHFSLSCIGEGNGNPLQCSCLENPRDGGVCGFAQSRTQLKWLSSSSSSERAWHPRALNVQGGLG